MRGHVLGVLEHKGECSIYRRDHLNYWLGKDITTISLCASSGQAWHFYAEYRFSARDGATPFSYRAEKTSGSRIFNRATLIGASSASTVIWFENAGYVYEISDPVKDGRTVSVYKDGKQISLNSYTGNYLCDSDTPNPFIKQRTSEDYFEILDETLKC